MHENEGSSSDGGFGSISMTEAAIIGRAWTFRRNHWQKGLGVTDDVEALSLFFFFCSYVVVQCKSEKMGLEEFLGLEFTV